MKGHATDHESKYFLTPKQQTESPISTIPRLLNILKYAFYLYFNHKSGEKWGNLCTFDDKYIIPYK